MKLLDKVGLKIFEADPKTLSLIEAVLGFFTYVSLGFVFGIFVKPVWLAIALSLLFALFLTTRTMLVRIVERQHALSQTLEMFGKILGQATQNLRQSQSELETVLKSAEEKKETNVKGG